MQSRYPGERGGTQSNNERRLERKLSSLDSPVEGDGFELSVPRDRGWMVSFGLSPQVLLEKD